MAVIYVDLDATGVNNGSSWGNAFTDLQSALAIAGASDEIWVAEGTYLPTTDDDREVSFVIPSGVEVYGGFAGNELFLEQRDFEENVTILSGNIGANTAGDNSYHVVDITNTTASTVLNGLTIRDGNADGSRNFGNGGGVFGDSNASATIINSVVTNNSATEQGGGLYTGSNSSFNVINSVFTGNFASDGGGGIRAGSGSSNVINSLFYGNESQFGGAIFARFNDDIEISNSTFVNNSGGSADSIGLSNNSPEIEVNNSIFWNTQGRDDNHFDFSGSFSRRLIFTNSIIQGDYQGEEGSENNLTENPLFVDPDNNDFRLQLASPGIDGGDNDFINLETDIVGNTRIFNDTVDIGAYEYGLFLSIDDAIVVEAENDSANLEFTVNLVESLGQIPTEEIAVNYTIIEDTASASLDYTSTDGTVIFAPGETEQTITIPILDDDLVEQPEILFVELSNVVGNASIVDDSAIGIIQDDDINKTIQLFRLRNNTFSSGTFLYAGADERDAILNDPNLSNIFSLDGVNPDGTVNPAFTASAIPGEGLSPFFRLESLTTPGTFLFVSTGEYNAIFAEGSDQRTLWRRQGFDASGQDVPEFYLFGANSEIGTEFNRFQNIQNGTFLYAGPGETLGINSDPNLSSIFVDQGVAFKSLV